MRRGARAALIVVLALAGAAAVPPTQDGAAAARPARAQPWLLVGMGREGEATLNLIRPDGSGRRLVRRGEAGDPELSPDGRHILFMRHGDIVLMRTDGSHLRRLVDGPGGSDPIYFDASFTPSGSHVVFARYRRWYATELHAIRVDGTGRHLMTVLHGEYSSAGLSPDGRWIVAERSVDNAIGIWVTRRNGSRPRNLSRMGDDEFSWQPTFSPNGRWIAYSSWIHHVPQIFVMRRDGSGRRALTHYREGWNVWPVFSPDSRHIAFTREVGPDLHPRAVVIVMRTDGTRKHRITPYRASTGVADWGLVPPSALP